MQAFHLLQQLSFCLQVVSLLRIPDIRHLSQTFQLSAKSSRKPSLIPAGKKGLTLRYISTTYYFPIAFHTNWPVYPPDTANVNPVLDID